MHFVNLLVSRTVVFIGYSLNDPDFQETWKSISEQLGTMRRYAYLLTIGEIDENINKILSLGIKVINILEDPKNSNRILGELFKELNNYWRLNNRKLNPRGLKCLLPIKSQNQNGGMSGKTEIIDGDVYYFGNVDKNWKKLTTGGKCASSLITPDGEWVVYVRTHDGSPRREGDPPLPASLCAIRIDGSEPKILLNSRQDHKKYPDIESFWNLQFTNDGEWLYFQSHAWATSSAIFRLDMRTGLDVFICPGNSLEILVDGDYEGYLIVSQHKYYIGGGSYDCRWLLDSDGNTIGPISDLNNSFKDLY